jgi:MoxR-like ATPase
MTHGIASPTGSLTVVSVAAHVQAVRAAVATVVVGASETVELALIALLAGGHVLVEDVPGTGKTTLMKALAGALGCAFTRIQGTPDLLPSDVTGTSTYDPSNGTFSFRPGPIFGQVVLVDEVNRATPRTQAAFLEAMAEGQSSADGETRPLPKPFLVLATQNPIELEGTFPLPEAQLDRFLVRAPMGYPSENEELEVVRRFAGDTHRPAPIEPSVFPETVLGMQQTVARVHVSDAVAAYATSIVRATRCAPRVAFGASPRATVGLVRAARARAAIRGRDFVLPDDVQALATPVLAHRLVLDDESRLRQTSAEATIATVVASTEVPVESIRE